MIFIVKLIGVWSGIFSRMLLPFLRKMHQGKIKKFNIKYLYQTIASLILSTIFTIVIFPRIPLFNNNPESNEALFGLFCFYFAFGFGFNSLIIEFKQWFS